MRQVVCWLSLGFALAYCAPISGQMLMVDRGLSAGAAGMPLGKTTAEGFIGDHFQIGGRGEVWIIDTIRTWAVVGKSNASQASLVELFEKATLFGGIEAVPPEPGRPPQPECDCHNLMIIKSAGLSTARSGSDVFVSSLAGGVWQVDFRNLHWSVPGGIAIQFGVMGVARYGNDSWYSHAAAVGGAHELKAFDEKGKLIGPYMPEGAPADSKIGLNVQVWAYKTVPVAIRSSGTTIEVVLRSSDFFDAATADMGTLRFGPKNAAPVSSRLETIEGRAALVGRFRRADAGIQGVVVSACLTGRQQDGVPFEGCDLVASK